MTDKELLEKTLRELQAEGDRVPVVGEDLASIIVGVIRVSGLSVSTGSLAIIYAFSKCLFILSGDGKAGAARLIDKSGPAMKAYLETFKEET